jgi:hypothetical protein
VVIRFPECTANVYVATGVREINKG